MVKIYTPLVLKINLVVGNFKQFYKGSLGKKDISSSQKTAKYLRFEGFFDALSFVEINENFNGDLLVFKFYFMYKNQKRF